MRFKFALILIVLAVALGFIGYYGHNTLSQLINSIRKESQPNIRLSLLQDISTSLIIGENSINRFNLTKIPNDLDNYYETVSTIDAKLDSFLTLSPGESQLQESLQLKQLIEDKLVVTSDLIKLKDKESTFLTYNRILHAIRKQEDNSLSKQKVPSVVSQQDSIMSESEEVEANSKNQLAVKEKPKKQSIFKKIFGRKKKTQQKEVAETGQSEAAGDIVALTTRTDPKSLDLKENEEIKSIITRIGQEERAISQQLADQELELLARDREISLELRQLIDRITEAEQSISYTRSRSAVELSTKTEEIIAITIVITLGIIVMLIGIVLFDLAQLNKKRAELKLAKEAAEKMAQAKQEFLATMSHEIRTPLTAIMGFTDQLDQTIDQAKRSRFIEIVRKSSDHLLSIINDILDYSKLESGVIQTDSVKFSPQKEVESVLTMFEAQAMEKGISMSVRSNLDPDLLLMGDAFRYKQILINLIGNALKFTTHGSISAELSRSKDRTSFRVITTITDTGIGITKERIKSIFNKFEQADSSTARHYGGTGLGLPIVKKLVHFLNGSIDIESTPGSGTTVAFELPFEQIKSDEKSQDDQEIVLTTDYSQLRILVVDDEPYNLELIKTILEKEGVEVSVAENGLDGMDLLQQNQFDLAIVDIQMPGINGLDMAKSVRQLDSERSKIPLLASTAAISENDVDSIKNAGFDGCMLKPLKAGTLLTKVDEVLKAMDSDRWSQDITQQIDSFNVDELSNLSQGNSEFMVNMLRLYHSSTVENFKLLAKSIDPPDLQQIKYLAHKMVSPTRHLNLKHFTSLLKDLELMANDNVDMDRIKLQVQKAENAWRVIEPTVKMKMEELQLTLTSTE